MARHRERELSLAEAERRADGLPIGVRLRVAIELLRSLADAPPAPALPRGGGSRLLFAHVVLDPENAVRAAGPGDASGAALVLWEICAGRPLDGEAPVRLHDIVDDMPADVDDLVMGLLRGDAPSPTAAELLDLLVDAGERYAVARDALWDLVPGEAPSQRAVAATLKPPAPPAPAPTVGGKPPDPPREDGFGLARSPEPSTRSKRAAAPASKRMPRPPSADPPAPTSKRASRPPPADATPPTSKRASRPPAADAPAPTSKRAPSSMRTSATMPSMKAVVPPPVAMGETPKPPVAMGETPKRPAAMGETPKPPAAARPPSPALLLIHAGDEAPALASALRAAGYPVVLHGDAASGLARAIAENPMCILCDSDLPDADGDEVARRIREQPSVVADIPFVLLVADGETRGRLAQKARFGVGADVCLSKPITTAALIQQVDALVEMSSRLRAAHHARSALPQVSEATALRGDIREVGIAAVLTILDLERRTGSFVATHERAQAPRGRASLAEIDPGDALELELARGCVAGASALGVPARPVDVVRAMMRLAAGRFAFKPRKARSVDAPSLREVLSEAARLEDEAAAGRS